MQENATQYRQGEKVIVRPRSIEEYDRPYVAEVVRLTPKRITVRCVETDEADGYLYRLRAEGREPNDSVRSVEPSCVIRYDLAAWTYLRELGQALRASATMRYNLEAEIARVFAKEAEGSLAVGRQSA